MLMSGTVFKYFTETGIEGRLLSGVGQMGNVSHAVDAETDYAFFSFFGHYFGNGGSVDGEAMPQGERRNVDQV